MGQWLMPQRLELGSHTAASPGRGPSWLFLVPPWPIPHSVYGMSLGAHAGMVGDEHPHDILRWPPTRLEFVYWVAR